MLAQKKWNRRQFQAVLLGSLLLSLGKTRLQAKSTVATASQLLVQANNALALFLLRELDFDKGGNHFLSPFSIQSALTMAVEGARGETAAEMGKALQYPEAMKQSSDVPWDMIKLRSDFRMFTDRMRPDDSAKAKQLRTEVAKFRGELAKANEQVTSLASAQKFKEANAKSTEAKKLADRINELAKQVNLYELTNANSLWIDKSFKISPKYQSIITENYRPTAVTSADFRNKPDAERQRINQWVSDQTREKIRDVIPMGSINPLTRLVIANAIYFKGTWATPFNADFTKPAPFTLSDQSKITVPLMNMNSLKEAKYAAFNADGSVFETPKLVDENFEEHSGYPSKDGYQVAELPYNGDSISMMIFLPTKADFSGLSETGDPELHIAAVFHKAFVEVNEKGTEAAAATVVQIDARSALIKRPFIPHFNADRPFLFVIREKSSGLILFVGKVENPSA